MYKIENETSKFHPYDICKVVENSELVIITEVNQNNSQDKDFHQWSFSAVPINPKARIKLAWYSMDELVHVNNIFNIIAERSRHPFATSEHIEFIKNRRITEDTSGS